MNPRFFDLLSKQIWQIAALAIVVAVIVRLIAKNRPHLAHVMWMLVLIKCVTPPLWGHSLGVFSQLQATFAPDESAVLPTEPETNLTPPDASVIELSTLPMELAAAEDRLLEFDEHEDSVFDSESGSPFEVVTFDDNDAVESAETLSAIAAVGIASSKPAADDIDYRSMLMFLLCTGAITTLFVMIFRCLRCLRLIHHHRTTEFDESLSFRIQQLSKQLRIRRAPQIIVSNVLFGPAVLGLLRHTIVLPRCLFEIMEGSNSYAVPSPLRSGEKVADRPDEGSAPEPTSIDVQLQFLDPILAHELIHIRRGDLRTGTLQAIVQSLWWFHPAVWFANRWLSREAERCCDEQVIAELGCTPGHYARSLLSVIESKHRLQPIPVFPGMRPVEITAQRMERIMSLKNGLKKRTPLWCWLMIAALAFIVLPGAVAQPASEEQPPLETESDSAINARESAAPPAPQVEVSTKVYDVGELLTRLAADESISTEEARESLVGIFERAVSQVMEMPQGFPALPKVAESPSVLAPPPPRQLSSISIDGDQLTVVQSDTGHAKLKEEMDRFRKFGFKRFQVTARSIIGSAEEINALMSSLKMEEPFSDITKAPVVDAKSEQSAVTTIQMGTTGIVSRYLIRAIEELARSKTNCLNVESLQIQSFNGQTRMTHVGEMKPYIVGFDEKDEPTIRMVIDGMTLHVTPTVLDAGLIRLQCVSKIETVSKTHTVAMSRSSGKFPKRIQVPVIESKQVQTVVELQDDQTLWLSGLTSSHDGKSQAILFTLEVTLISLPYDIVDQPRIDDIRIVGDPVGSQVVANHGESISTVKPKDQPIVERPESIALRVPALPLPRWISTSSDPLVNLVWDARNASRRRLLMADLRTPWQFMNGLAALRRDFLIREGNEAVVGLDWLQNCKAFPGQPWFQETEFGGQPNPEPVPIWFDGHAEQFIATLAMNGVPLDATCVTPDGTITVGDMVKHLQMTVKEKKLSPWTLICLSMYLPRHEKWTNANGEQWSIERLVQAEVNKPDHTATCLSLMSLAVARNHYFQAGETLDGIWLQADQRILAAIEKARPKQTSDGRIITAYAPKFQSTHVQYRSQFGPRIPTPKSAPAYIEQAQMDLEARERIRMAAFPTDIGSTNRAQMLLFLTLALPANQLGTDWIRREIETAANELVADWSDHEIRSPFYENTHALTVYLERYPKYLEYVAEAGLSPVLAGNNHVHVRVKGMVRQPSSYTYVGNNGPRLLEAITKAGGPSDESADIVSVIRKAGNQPQPIIFHVNLQRLKSRADPDFYVMTGDEVLVHPAEIVNRPLKASIRLDDNFVLSPDASIDGSTVILFLNNKPITVEQFMGSGWGTLAAATELSDIDRRRVVSEAIISGLPEFVFQELILQHFDAALPELDKNLSHEQRETANRNFGEALQQLPRTADSRVQAQYLVVILAKESAANTASRQQQVDGFVRGWQPNTVASNKSAVVKHVQELVMTARLRSVVSLDYTKTTLIEVLRSVEQVHGLRIKVNSLHDQISQRIFDRPAAVDFHSENKPLGETLTTIFAPFGLTLSLDAEQIFLQFANSEQAMENFQSLPGPPSFGVFGVLKSPGWHPLDREIRLLDALTIAGAIENSDGVSIDIINPDIISGRAVPVSMSLRVLQNDTSGKLNRVIRDGDIINVTRNSSAEGTQAKRTERLMFGEGIKGDSAVVGTLHIDEASSLQLRQAIAKRKNIELRMLKNAAQLSSASSTDEIVQLERKKRELELELENVPIVSLSGTGIVQAAPTTTKPNDKTNLSNLAPGTYVASVPQKRLSPGRAPQEAFTELDRPTPPAVQQSSDPQIHQVWQMRESIRNRLLSTDQFRPWQLMQGLNGLHRDFVLKHDGKVVNGLEWIQTGPMFEDEPWFQKTEYGGQAHPYTKPYVFQGLINQFAATLAMCDVPLDAQFGTPDGPVKMEDIVKHAQMTANDKEEVSWTLQLLCKYLPPDAEWMNAKGEKWSIERLVKTTISKATPYGSPDGGTFGLFALAVARNEYLRTGKPLAGVWLDADKLIQKHIQLVRDQQHSNGTLSSNFFRGHGEETDFDKRLASSGALLRFLMMAVSDEQLKEDWVRQAVAATVKDLNDNRQAFVSCSSLFSATNALGIFLDRVALPAAVSNKLQSKDDLPAARFVLCAYPVADLVVNRKAVIAAASQTSVANDSAQQPVNAPESSEKSGDEPGANSESALPETKSISFNVKADFAPLAELIKATVQPNSWTSEGCGLIAVEEKSQTLVIKQTQTAHDEIATLLSQLRNDQDANVRIQCRIVRLRDDSQMTWLEKQCSLHPLSPGSQWALLPQQRCEAFAQALLDQKPEVLFVPTVMTISGQAATIATRPSAAAETALAGIRLEITPHLLPESKVIRLQHTFSIGASDVAMPNPIESLVGSGQTLVLLVNAPEEKDKATAEQSHYLLMLTPEHVPLKEEEEEVVSPQPDGDANGTR